MEPNKPPDTDTDHGPSILYRRPNAQSSTAVSAPASPPVPALPSISDYWPDAPQRTQSRESEVAGTTSGTRMRPSATIRTRPSGTPSAPPVAPSRRRLALPLGLTAAALLLAGIGVVGARLVQRPASPSGAAGDVSPTAAPQSARPSVSPVPTGPVSLIPSPPAVRNTISGPVDGRTAATFELLSNAIAVNLRAASLGADLYRITTPEDSGVLPRVAANKAGIRLTLQRPAKRKDTTVEVVLNSRIRWSLVMTGGVRTSVLNLAATNVGRVDLNGGATRIELTLPRPDGTIAIRMTGGANQFLIRTAGDVPARLNIRRGAGKVVFDGRTDNGVDRNSVFTSAKFAGSQDRIDVDAVGGVGTLTVGPSQ